MEIAKKVAPKVERHLSTQMSTTSSLAIEYYKKRGVSRVVLAREVTLCEIEQIMKKTNTEVEVFVHGGMCSSYSGHCVLSNHMTNRDANRGGCAHSCRWNYTLYKDGIEQKEFYNIGSKDLMALKYIPKMIELGVASLKIEGRMKSMYYLAVVVRSYRMLIDAYYEKGYVTELDLKRAEIEIGKAVRASMSFPGIFTTCNYGKYNFIDGGTKDNLPVQILKDMGAKKILALSFKIDEYEPKEDIFAILLRAVDIFSLKDVRKAQKAADLALEIDVSGTSLLKIDNIDKVIKTGYDTIMKNKNEILKMKEVK
jgi:hypothetical protein